MSIDEGNEKIAKFMGYPFKVEVTQVTQFNYGMDSYYKKFIYCNKLPNLVNKEDKFANQVLSTYDDFFDINNQDENFKYLSFLNYDSDYNSIMKVVKRIQYLGNFEYIKDSYLRLNINYLWLSVVEFVDWYLRDSKIESALKITYDEKV